MSINTATRIAIANPASIPAEVEVLAFEFFPYQRSKHFGDDYVTFGVTQDLQVYFAINGEYKYSPSQKQVAIVKWLLSQFFLIKKYLPKDKYLICKPFEEDEALPLRVKAFTRVGFEEYKSYPGYMVYDPYGILYQEEPCESLYKDTQVTKLTLLMLGELASREANRLCLEMENLREENILLREVDLSIIISGLGLGAFASTLALGLGLAFQGPNMEVKASERALAQSQVLHQEAVYKTSTPQWKFCKFLKQLHGGGVKCDI